MQLTDAQIAEAFRLWWSMTFAQPRARAACEAIMTEFELLRTECDRLKTFVKKYAQGYHQNVTTQIGPLFDMGWAAAIDDVTAEARAALMDWAGEFRT